MLDWILWIAAQSMEDGVEFITSDQHFEKISGLVYSIFPPPIN